MRNDWWVMLACGVGLLFSGSARPVRELTSSQSVPANGSDAPAFAKSQPALLFRDVPFSPFTPTISKNIEEVRLVFSVVDRQGRLVSDVTPTDVQITDDEQIVPELTSFVRASDLPLRLGLLLDVSESMSKGFTAEQRSAVEFLNRVGRTERDHVFVLGFSSSQIRSTTYQDPSSLFTLVRDFHPGGLTALYDAVCAASLDDVMTRTEQFPVRRVLVVLSDGQDTQSRHTLRDAISWAQRAEIALYAITVHSPKSDAPGDPILKDLAGASGGRAFILNNYSQLSVVFAQIEEELRSQYVVTYRRPQSLSRSSFHAVQVAIPSQPALKVNCRTGYFANAPE